MVMLFSGQADASTAGGRPTPHGPWRSKSAKKGTALLVATGLYTQAVPGVHRAGPRERGGGSYGRRTVATAERAAMQISGVGKGLRSLKPRSIII